jgi:lysozyme
VENEIEPLLRLIRHFESCRLRPYYCPAGILTCGWGSTGTGVYPGYVWTQAQADSRLLLDATNNVLAVKSICPYLEGNKLFAITDFVYNVGIGAFRASTVRSKLDRGDDFGACKQLERWVYGGGRVLKGLVIRRRAEIYLFNS